MAPLKRTPSSVNAPETQCLWQSQTQVYYFDAFVRHTRLIYVRRLQPWIDFVTLYLGVMPALSRFPSLDPFLSIWPHIVPANLLSATAGGTLVLVYHMMHLPGGAQYVFDFRLCLKPTASSFPPPQPSTRMCGRLNAVSQNVGKMLWSALSCLFGVFVVEYERHFVRGHWNGFQKLQLFIEMWKYRNKSVFNMLCLEISAKWKRIMLFTVVYRQSLKMLFDIYHETVLWVN